MILQEDPYGRRSIRATDSDEELAGRWEQLQEEHEGYRHATQSQETEQNDEPPRIWVTSLADYTAGHLHGAWLDATRRAGDLQLSGKAASTTASALRAEGTDSG